mmetsp:Transcript_144727/g.252294  ORF Transcript_144727/g.252294 Transcript_144727/m.252294 type:complete len:109 (-) Transcript_144727:246-572(-)
MEESGILMQVSDCPRAVMLATEVRNEWVENLTWVHVPLGFESAVSGRKMKGAQEDEKRHKLASLPLTKNKRFLSVIVSSIVMLFDAFNFQPSFSRHSMMVIKSVDRPN